MKTQKAQRLAQCKGPIKRQLGAKSGDRVVGQALRFLRSGDKRACSATDFKEVKVRWDPLGPLPAQPNPPGAPRAPSAPSRAVEFETHGGIPALDRKGVGASSKQICPSCPPSFPHQRQHPFKARGSWTGSGRWTLGHFSARH